AYVAELVDDKNTTIRKLRQLFFGKRTEKTEAVLGRAGDQPAVSQVTAAPAELTSAPENPEPSPPTDPAANGQGHGRHAAAAYRGAERIEVRYAALAAGDPCPSCGQGTVYEKVPGVVVRITGRPPLAATVYQLQKLRCHLCGEVFTA